MSYYVDIPQASNVNDFNDGAYLNVAKFETKAEAIAFAKEWFGADDDGKVSLVSGG